MIKYVYEIDYPLGEKRKYLEWVRSVADTLRRGPGLLSWGWGGLVMGVSTASPAAGRTGIAGNGEFPGGERGRVWFHQTRPDQVQRPCLGYR
jgi:hypothetical protein